MRCLVAIGLLIWLGTACTSPADQREMTMPMAAGGMAVFVSEEPAAGLPPDVVGAAGAAAADGGTGGETTSAGGMAQTAVGGSAGSPPVITASCTDTDHPVCLDFESGDLPNGFNAPNTDKFAIEAGHAAHGDYAMHVSDLRTKPSALVTTSELGSIEDVMWGRYYLYMSPGAPWGHGAMVWVGDARSPTNFYEVGFESNAVLGMWIQGEGWLEKYMRSTVTIPGDEWLCIEFSFDGATPSVGRYWMDGSEIVFDPNRIAGTDPIQNYPGPEAVLAAERFTIFKIGIEFYHGSSLVSCPEYPPWLCPSYNGDEAPYVTDIWIDDVALDTERIGCL